MIRARLTNFAVAAALGAGVIGAIPAAAGAATRVTATVGLPKMIAKPGDKCAKGTEGCHNGKFTGDFFGG
jgi:hypothetical protein